MIELWASQSKFLVAFIVFNDYNKADIIHDLPCTPADGSIDQQ